MNARRYALRALMDIYHRGTFMQQALTDCHLPIDDQRLMTRMVYLVVANDTYLQFQYEDLLRHNCPLEVHLILKLALAQAMFLDKVPDYALVNDAVELTRMIGRKTYAGFVNAILRQVLRRGILTPQTGVVLADAAIRYSFPDWIMQLLARQYTPEFALAYAKQTHIERAHDVRINPRHRGVEELLAEGLIQFDGSNYLATPSLFSSSALQRGDVLIQDRASQAVVRHLDLHGAKRILDACAAPGTKTMQLADFSDPEAQIDAVDLHPVRVALIEQLAMRWGVDNKIQTHVADARQFGEPESYDVILLDAPCSGLGVLAHKADLKWHIKSTDLDDLEQIQRSLLAQMAILLRPGGVLMYATCTLNSKENQRQVAWFMSNYPEYDLLEESLPDPLNAGSDGFYFAKMRRAC